MRIAVNQTWLGLVRGTKSTLSVPSIFWMYINGISSLLLTSNLITLTPRFPCYGAINFASTLLRFEAFNSRSNSIYCNCHLSRLFSSCQVAGSPVIVRRYAVNIAVLLLVWWTCCSTPHFPFWDALSYPVGCSGCFTVARCEAKRLYVDRAAVLSSRWITCWPVWPSGHTVHWTISDLFWWTYRPSVETSRWTHIRHSTRRIASCFDRCLSLLLTCRLIAHGPFVPVAVAVHSAISHLPGRASSFR